MTSAPVINDRNSILHPSMAFRSTLRYTQSVIVACLMGIGYHPSMRSGAINRFVKSLLRGATTCNLPQWLLSSQLSPALGIEPSLHLAHWDIKYLPKPNPLNSFSTAPLVHLRCSLNFTCIIPQNLLFVKQNFEDF